MCGALDCLGFGIYSILCDIRRSVRNGRNSTRRAELLRMVLPLFINHLYRFVSVWTAWPPTPGVALPWDAAYTSMAL
jgi:hypothetical protein